ncbi:MAG TPA: hypothetical protein VJR23_10390 [Candidatus Acidoferrales bacterium]|nr:hypothetical protein [Candidatus Acidoferrales bacterium]
MRRSVGVTISAVIVFVGCGLVLLQALGTAFAAFALTSMQQEPSFLGPILIFEVIFLVGLAGWGIATGVGLIRLRNWARISMIVFSVLLVICTLVPALLFMFVPLPIPSNAKDPEMMARIMTMMRVVIEGFGLGLAALGIWWLYFFAKQSTRAQFAGGSYGAASAAPAVASGLQFDVPPPMRRLGRPVSITVIAVLLIIPACFAPLSLIEMRVVFPGQQLPFMFFGIFVTGSIGVALFLALMVAQAIAGVGLLKLRPWARILAIWLEAYTLLNMVATFALPSGRARFDEWMNSLMASEFNRIKVPAQIDMKPMLAMISKSAVWGVVIWLPVFAVIIWFLVKEKEAFYRPKQGGAPIS